MASKYVHIHAAVTFVVSAFWQVVILMTITITRMELNTGAIGKLIDVSLVKPCFVFEVERGRPAFEL